jgi:hypothetical protein
MRFFSYAFSTLLCFASFSVAHAAEDRSKILQDCLNSVAQVQFLGDITGDGDVLHVPAAQIRLDQGADVALPAGDVTVKQMGNNVWTIDFSDYKKFTLDADATLYEGSVKDQKSYIVWDQNKQRLNNISLNLSDIILSQDMDKIQIGKAVYNQQIEHLTEGLSDQLGKFNIQNIRFDTAQAKGSIDKMILDADLKNALSPAKVKEIMHDGDAVLSALMLMFKNYNGNGQQAFAVQNLKLQNSINGQNENLSLANLSLNTDLNGAQGTQGNRTVDAKTRLSYDGLSYQGFRVPNAIASQIIPSEMVMDYDLKKLPILKILEAINNDNAIVTQTKTADMKGGTLAQQLKSILNQAGTTMTIQPSHLKSAALQLYSTGELKAANDPKSYVLGSIKNNIVGLDAMTAQLDTLANSNADPKITASVRKILPVLAMMQVFGAKEKAPNGQDSRAYHLSFDQNGKILMNGADIGTLIGQ